jgi:fructose-bisphosphate aldolase, class I
MSSSLIDTAKILSSSPGVIVAADESPSTMKSRLESVGVTDSFEMRAKWRELIATSQIAQAGASGIILHPEMLEVSEVIEPLRKQNIIIVVKIDGGLEDFGLEGEQTTKYADNMEELLIKWKELGAQATKFRSVFKISDTTPSDELIAANAKIQAKFAKLSQDAGLVPMIEPEVLRNGAHSPEKDREVTSKVLDGVFAEVSKVGVDFTQAILKPNMVTPGEDFTGDVEVDEVAKATLEVLENHAPKEIAGINFLSGGIPDELAEKYLNRICQLAKDKGKENISASFGRAIVGAPLKIWVGKEENVRQAQEALVERVKRSSLARQGKLS